MTYLTNAQHNCHPVRTRRYTLTEIIEVHRQRRALARLNAHALEDVGITRDEAMAEARRPFWDLPAK